MMAVLKPRRPDPWLRAYDEPRIADVLADPIIQLLMKRDSLSSGLLQDVILQQSLFAKIGKKSRGKDS